MFYIDKNTELTLDNIKSYINAFKINEYPRLKKLDNYYLNKNDKIRLRTFEDETKPNNKVSHSFAQYITTTNVAMLLGNPVSYKSEENIEVYQDILDKADEQDINNSLAKDASKFGYGIQLMYLNEDLDINFAVLNPLQTVLIYSNDIKPKVLYAINFWTNKDIIKNTDVEYIRVYSKEVTRTYKENVLIEDEANQFNDIPIFIYKNNDDMLGDYELVISLIDAYDFLESDSINESDYFNNCYFHVKTELPMDSDLREELITELKGMKENRTIINPDDVGFITKPIIENEVEKVRLVQDIHKLAYVPDMSDKEFANNVSGVAMKYKLLLTLFNIKNKQAKFEQAINERNKVLFEMMKYRMMKVPEYVDIVFNVSLPVNDLEIAQMINQLSGKLSNQTSIGQLSFVKDPAYEMELKKKEDEINSFEVDLNKEDDKDEEN